MPEQVWIGLDLGTQGVRAVALTGDGDVLGREGSSFISRRRGSRHEQDPDRWWEAAAGCLQLLARRIPSGAVGGIAVASTSGTIVGLDAHGRPVSPGLMYDDARASSYWRQTVAAGPDLWPRLGYSPQPTWALTKICWLHENVADLRYVVHQADVVTRALVGGPVPTDSSTALKSGYDTQQSCWPVEVLDLLGLPLSLLPDVVGSGTVLGTVCAPAAALTGLPAGTPVIAGMTDGCAAQISSGAVAEGQWNSSLGTTLVLKGVSSQPARDPSGSVYSHLRPGGLWFTGGASSTGAGVLTRLFPGADLDELTASAAETTSFPACYPLAGRGERFPFLLPEATGFALLNRHVVSLSELVRRVGQVEAFGAVLSGVALVERLCLERMVSLGMSRPSAIRITGGGSTNTWWRQLRADVLGCRLEVPSLRGSAEGMAILASSVGSPLTQRAERMVRVVEDVEPMTTRQAGLTERFHELVDGLAARGWIDNDPALSRRRGTPHQEPWRTP